MLDKAKHKTILIKILKDFYSNPEVGRYLGFKGGTAAFLFYGLSRLSVDLDFDLLNKEKKEEIFKEVPKILSKYGQLIEAVEKRFTLFFLLSYKQGERKIKIEISKRDVIVSYEVKSLFGVPVLVMKKEDMAAFKLVALLTRKKFASRDLFDLWFFLKNDWAISERVIKERTGLSLKEALAKAIEKAKSISKKQLLQGLGDLLEKRQKNWVKDRLKQELIFYLKLYLERIGD